MGIVKVQLFGAFRQCGDGQELAVEMDSPMTVASFRELLSHKFQESVSTSKLCAVLQDSAVAGERDLLNELSIIQPGQSVSLLPPVCGG